MSVARGSDLGLWWAIWPSLAFTAVIVFALALACGSTGTASLEVADVSGGAPPTVEPPGAGVDSGADAGVGLPPRDAGSRPPDAGRPPTRDAGVTRDAGAATDAGALAAEVKSDLVFRTIGGKSLAGDLYLPARSAPVAAVLVIPGGAGESNRVQGVATFYGPAN